MSEEDRPQKYSISNGGRITYSRSSKRQKQNKVPQRGLGVAKLEKMRLEEEQRMKASSSSNSSFNLPLSLPNFHPSSQIPLPSATTVPLSSSTVSVPVNRNGGFAGLLGYKSVPKDFGMDPGLGFLSSLLYKSNPNWTLPNVIQRKRQPQQPSSSSSSSMANLSSGTSSTLLPQVSMEPPLIQNNSHRYVPIRPMEKMIGIKRQNPFSMDVLPAPSFSFNFPTFAAPMNTNEEISSGSGSGVNLDHAGKTTFSSEAPSYSASNSEMIYKGNENFNRDFDFLKLSHPHSTSSLHLKTTSTLTPYQGVQENQIPSPSEYIFIPPAANVAQTEQTRDELQNSNAVGGVDLNLKL